MDSSTSSSKGLLCRRAITVAAILLLGYEALIRLHLVPYGEGLSQTAVNVIRAEQYATRADHKGEVVLVGSSLMGKLQREPLVGNVASLAQGGSSSMTGLDVLRHTPSVPSSVVVEISTTIDRKAEARIADAAYGNTSKATGIFHCLMQSYNPTNVLLTALKRRTGKGGESSATNDALRKERIRQVATENSVVDSARLTKLTKSLEDVKAILDEMAAKGVKVYLVEIPGEPEIDGSPFSLAFIQRAHQTLPDSQYRWIQNPTGVKWETSDGVHLTPPLAKQFLAEILRQVS